MLRLSRGFGKREKLAAVRRKYCEWNSGEHCRSGSNADAN
jgi:hypothetical protein